jgi:cytochrome c
MFLKAPPIVFRNIDLTGIAQVVYALNPNTSSGHLEFRLDAPEGKLLGATEVISKESKLPKSGRWLQASAKLTPSTGLHDVYVVFNKASSVSIWNAFYMNSVHFQTAGEKI